VKTAASSRTHREGVAICTGAELKQSPKRTGSVQLRISPRDVFQSLQAQLSTLTADLCEAKQIVCSIVGSSKAVAYLYTHRNLLGRIAAIFLLGTVAIVGIAPIRNTPEVSVVTAVPTETEINQPAKPEAAVSTKPLTGPKITTVPMIGEFGFSFGSAEQSIPTRPLTRAKEPLAAPKPESRPSEAGSEVAEAPQPSPEPTAARKEFVEIAVELRIQDGRVAEAHVGNRQPGAEAFEATALQIARQRRYPPGTSRTEKLVLRVANQFGRKEP
jgi:hypothetical protein